MKVVVIGGGVIGLCCAVSLAERDAEVTLLERAAVGSGASAGNAGWVVPSLGTPLGAPGMLRTGIRSALDPRGALVIRPALDTSWIRWLWQFRRSCSPERYTAGVRALLTLTRRTLGVLDAYAAAGVAFEEHRTGILAVARSPAGLAWFATLHEELARLGMPGAIEQLSPGDARTLEPALGPAVGAAMHASVDRHVEPGSLTAGLAAHLRDRGGIIEENCDVHALRRAAGGWMVAAGDLEHRCDAVVVATGAAANALLRPLGVRLPLVGAKGYSVTLQGRGTAPSHAVYLCEPKLGLSPFDAGLRIAGFFELPARTTEPSPHRIQQLLDDTVSYLADWLPDGATHTGWAGLRPATPDSLPFLGPVDGLDGLVVATGHGMLGVTLAPATGDAVAEMILTASVPDELQPFRVGRRI